MTVSMADPFEVFKYDIHWYDSHQSKFMTSYQLHAIMTLGLDRGAFHKPLRVIFRTFQELWASWEQQTLVAEMVG